VKCEYSHYRHTRSLLSLSVFYHGFIRRDLELKSNMKSSLRNGHVLFQCQDLTHAKTRNFDLSLKTPRTSFQQSITAEHRHDVFLYEARDQIQERYICIG